MKSFEPVFMQNLVLPHRMISIIRAIGEHKGRQELYQKQAADMLENLRQVALIQSTECSNRLEGITVDAKRLKALVELKTSPQDRPEGEIAGYRDVLSTIHSSAQHIPLTPNVILQLHRDMMKYTDHPGGQWKVASNEITETLPDGSQFVRFSPVEPYQVSEFMQQLHQQYRDYTQDNTLDTLILIPLYVLDFLCIHPFLDGNGRMARMLTVLLLYQAGYEVGRYISLERIIEQTKESYYDTLYRSSQAWHEGKHDILPWLEYCLSTFLAAYKEFESRLGTLSTGYGSKRDMILNAIKAFIGDFSISDIERACPTVGRDMIRNVLDKLRKDEQIQLLGKGPKARWQKLN